VSAFDRPRVVASGRSVSALRADHPAVIGTPLVFYAMGFVAGLLANWVAPQLIAPPQLAMPTGATLLIAGALLAAWGKLTTAHQGASASPALPARSLVTTGPFRFTRNPLYVARSLLYVGTGLRKLSDARSALAIRSRHPDESLTRNARR
jgi:protein-S-isoprenylcysteine O-methyltransferase Ste14